MPRRWLGRAYPVDIQDSIMNLSRSLDELMAGSLEYTQKSDLDVSNQIRDLNARLVNNVIIESDKITDEEARARLQELRDPISTLQIAYRQSSVSGGYPTVPTTASLAIIPRSQAEELLASLKESRELYVDTVNRYVEARPAAEAALAMPVSGNIAAAMISDVDRKFNAADRYTSEADEATKTLEALLEEPGDAVQMDRSTFDMLRSWISRIREVDQAVQRLEGMTGRKPIDSPILATMQRIPWWVMALVAAGALTGIAFLATAKKP